MGFSVPQQGQPNQNGVPQQGPVDDGITQEKLKAKREDRKKKIATKQKATADKARETGGACASMSALCTAEAGQKVAKFGIDLGQSAGMVAAETGKTLATEAGKMAGKTLSSLGQAMPIVGALFSIGSAVATTAASVKDQQAMATMGKSSFTSIFKATAGTAVKARGVRDDSEFLAENLQGNGENKKSNTQNPSGEKKA